MSGQGSRFRAAGYTPPKPAIPVNGRPMIERLLGVMPERWPTTFVMAESHRATELPALLKRLRPQGRQLYVPDHAEGPGRALAAALEALPKDVPTLVSYCDYGMVWDPARFEDFVAASACDACLVSYRGFHPHYLSTTTYAYSRLEGERVVEVREKGSFTDRREQEFASCGAYYFKSAALLAESLAEQARRDLRLNGETYTSLTVQALLAARPAADVRTFEIQAFFQWGTPDDLRDFEYWERTFAAHARVTGIPPGPQWACDQLLMPMAGQGSRFRELTPVPKPLIPLGGVPMYRRALATLPRAEKTVLVALEDAAKQLSSSETVVALPSTPPGQALSTEAGLAALAPKGDVVVTACDHGLVLDRAAWARFRAAPACDAAIFAVRGYPGARRRPKAYAYVVPEAADSGEFPRLARVAVKEPVSDRPDQDAVLVGSFWFRDRAVLQQGIDLLKRRDVRVNGEMYLDSIFPLLAEAGRVVRMVPLAGYLGWGDIDALAEAAYWEEVFLGRRTSVRELLREVIARA